jgi:hypothetical protein
LAGAIIREIIIKKGNIIGITEDKRNKKGNVL